MSNTIQFKVNANEHIWNMMGGVHKHAVLTLVLLDTANVARLEKRAVEGLLLDTGPVTMEETLEPTGGLLELGEDEKVAGGDAGLD